jgi:hypothetical protein
MIAFQSVILQKVRSRKRLRHFVILAAFVMIPVATILVAEGGATAPNSPRLICQVGNVTSSLSNSDIVLPIYLTNVLDSVAGFQLWISIADPYFYRFKVDSTIAGIHYAKFDSSGTRVAGWEFLAARTLSDDGGVIKVVGMAYSVGFPYKKPMAPGSGTLIKLFLQTNGILGDSVCGYPPFRLFVNKFETEFDDPKADIIGCNYRLMDDTIFSNCVHYVGDVCDSWADTTIRQMRVCDMDTTQRILLDGSLAFECCHHGDANNDEKTNISDAVYLVQYIFGGGPTPHPYCNGDFNCDCIVNISDAVCLINYIFQNGSCGPFRGCGATCATCPPGYCGQ